MITNYKIFEKYIESSEYKVKQLFLELEKNINWWFTEGELAKQGARLISNKRSVNNFIDKSYIIDFTDNTNNYQVIIVIPLEEVSDKDNIEDCFIKVKIYDNDDNLLRTYKDDLKIKDISEAKIIEIIAKIKSESGSILDETPNTLSDKDIDLKNNKLT
jgi:hypothetical protein